MRDAAVMREYCRMVSEPKREETRARKLVQVMDALKKGERPNEKYRK